MTDGSLIVLLLVVAAAQLLILLGIITAGVTFGLRRHAVWMAEGGLEKSVARREAEHQESARRARAAASPNAAPIPEKRRPEL